MEEHSCKSGNEPFQMILVIPDASHFRFLTTSRRDTLILTDLFSSNGLGSARSTAARLSEGSGGRVISLGYRLAPQIAFPNQILDLLVLYLSLLYPPAGSFHSSIPASSIVLAGESSGGCIVLGFIQALLHIKSKRLSFHGQRLDSIPMPAGITLLCPQVDLALCLPSWERNRDFDIWAESAPYLDPTFPTDAIWPSNPPREELYCPASFFSHPMVGSCTAESWKGAPPMWFGVGQERLVDASLVIAQTAVRRGVVVGWNQYEKMPHCWPFLMPDFPHSQHLYLRWSQACQKMAQGTFQSHGQWIDVETLEASDLDVERLTDLTPSDVRQMIFSKAATMPPYQGEVPTGRL
jgi:acetyl esterase/lipase